jgi:hypothetical protein
MILAVPAVCRLGNTYADKEEALIAYSAQADIRCRMMACVGMSRSLNSSAEYMHPVTHRLLLNSREGSVANQGGQDFCKLNASATALTIGATESILPRPHALLPANVCAIINAVRPEVTAQIGTSVIADKSLHACWVYEDTGCPVK